MKIPVPDVGHSLKVNDQEGLVGLQDSTGYSHDYWLTIRTTWFDPTVEDAP